MANEVHGIAEAHAVIAPDGRPQVVFVWPDGLTLILDRDECVAHCLTGLQAASHLFASAEELGQKINYARSQIMNLQPISFQ